MCFCYYNKTIFQSFKLKLIFFFINYHQKYCLSHSNLDKKIIKNFAFSQNWKITKVCHLSLFLAEKYEICKNGKLYEKT